MSYSKQQRLILEKWAYSSLSAIEIAKVLGVTKNTVVGLGYRLQQNMGAVSRDHLRKFTHGFEIDWDRLPKIPSTCTVPEKIVTPDAARRRIRTAAELQRKREAAHAKALAERSERERIARETRERERHEAEAQARKHAEALARLNTEGVSINELSASTCRAVIGEHPVHAGGLYCGQPVDHRCYCLHHCLKYFVPNVKKARSAGGGLVLRNLHAYAS